MRIHRGAVAGVMGLVLALASQGASATDGLPGQRPGPTIPPWQDSRHTHRHITYYHPGYFESGTAYGIQPWAAGYAYSTYYTPVGWYGFASPYPFPGHFADPAPMLNPSYGPVGPVLLGR